LKNQHSEQIQQMEKENLKLKDEQTEQYPATKTRN
jgi:uncharacterized protein YdcH (DUF465 family)